MGKLVCTRIQRGRLPKMSQKRIRLVVDTPKELALVRLHHAILEGVGVLEKSNNTFRVTQDGSAKPNRQTL